MHALTEANTNSAGGYVVDLDAKIRCGLFPRSLQEFVRVLNNVWMRE
jgi:hypothetical protein